MTSPIPPTGYLPASQAMLASRTSEAIGRSPDRRTGVVASFDGGILTVTVSGGATERVGYLADYRPVVGDVVALIQQRSTWLCLGAMGNPDEPLPPSSNGIAVDGPPAGLNASGAWITITGSSFTFVKRRDSSRVFAQILGSSYTNNVFCIGEYGLQINGVDRLLARFFFNVASTHLSFCGSNFLTGIPAGTYTVLGRVQRVGAAGNISIDVNDRISTMCTEVD